MSIAIGISKSLADNVVIAKVDGLLWDLERPLEKSCSLELLKFDDNEGTTMDMVQADGRWLMTF